MSFLKVCRFKLRSLSIGRLYILLGMDIPVGDVALSKCEEEVPELSLSPEEFAVLESFRETASRLIVLGQVPGPSPSYLKLKEWAFTNLHKSITACALIGNGYFEVSFAIEEGVKYTLSNVVFFEGREVPFTPWNGDFSRENSASSNMLEYPCGSNFLG